MSDDINESLLNESVDIPEPADSSAELVEDQQDNVEQVEDGQQPEEQPPDSEQNPDEEGEQDDSALSLNYEEIYSNVTEPVTVSGKPIFKQPVKFIEAKDLYKKNVIMMDANNNAIKAGLYNIVDENGEPVPDKNGQPTKVSISVDFDKTGQPIMFNDTYAFVECELNAAGNPTLPGLSNGTRMFLMVFGIVVLCLTIAIVAYWMWYLQDHKKRMAEADKITLERSNKSNDDFRNSFIIEDIRSTEEERKRLAEEQANILAKQEDLKAANAAADAEIKKAKAEAAELKAQADALKKKRDEQKAAQAAAESFAPNDPNMRTETFAADYVYNTNYKSMLMNQFW